MLKLGRYQPQKIQSSHLKIVCWAKRRTKHASNRSKRNLISFLPKKAKYTLLYNFLFYWFSSLRVKVDGCPGDDLHSFYPSKQTDTTWWTTQIHSNKLNWTRRGTFHELNSLSLFRLMKSLTFGLGLTKKNLILRIFILQNFISLSFKWY